MGLVNYIGRPKGVLVSKFFQIGGLVCINQIFGMVCWLVSQPR